MSLFWALLFLPFLCVAQQPFTVHDLHALTRLSGLVVSPKGDIAVYSIRTWTEATNAYDIHLESVAINSTTTKPLTGSTSVTQTSSNPVFSPDASTVAFLGDDPNTIYQVYLATGEVSVLATLPIPVTSFKWSPTGAYIVFSAKVYNCQPVLSCTASQINESNSKGPNTGWVYNQLYVRHWDTWEVEGMYSHLFQMNVKANGKGYQWTGEEIIDLLVGQEVNSPVPPFGGAEQYDISPDGRRVALTIETVEHDTAWKTGWAIWLVNVNPYSFVGSITNFTQARCQNPLFSPDGARLGYLQMNVPGSESDRLHFNYLILSSMTTVNDVSPAWDRSISGWDWTLDSQAILVDADEFGRHKAFRMQVIGGTVGQITSLLTDGNNVALTPVPGTNIVAFTRDTLMSPVDVWQFDITGGIASNTRQLTSYNSALLSKRYLPQAEWFMFPNEGANIQGFLIRPYGFDTKPIWPLAFLIHGGPESAWLDSWSYRWNPQLWASAGYAVVAINPHGSTGYGQNFTDAVADDWGGLPFRDLMTGASYVVSTYSWIDSKNLIGLGASYGGYMINWINGHDNRFKALVCHDGVFSTLGMYYSTEELFFEEYEFGPPPFTSSEANDAYEKWSPSAFIQNWVTPTLVIHGGHDYRIAEAEGIATFTALQRKGIKSRFLYFPEENHWVLNPPNGILWYDTVLDWMSENTGTSLETRDERKKVVKAGEEKKRDGRRSKQRNRFIRKDPFSHRPW